MSNGSSSCPTVTFPFGLFAATNTIQPLDPSDFPSADPPPGFEQFVLDTLGNAATPDDGFDQVATEAASIVDALDSALGTLDALLGDAFTEADTIDPTPVGDTVSGYVGSLQVSSTAVDALGNTLAAVTSTPGGTSGGGGGVQQSGCGTGALSTLGAFTGQHCDEKSNFRVQSVAAGPCYFKAPTTPTIGHTNFPVIKSFTLQSGDPDVWRLGFHTEKASDGTVVYWYDVTVTPKLLPATGSPIHPLALPPKPPPNQKFQVPSHFDAVTVLVLDKPAQTMYLCWSVDCVP